jgi:gluconate 2-dehydrogenase gamma chain
MDRRKSIKALVVGTVSTGILIEACDTPDKKAATPDQATATPKANADRMAEEIEYNKKISENKFFTAHELATVGVLSDIIIPKDDISGSATDAKVPEFIDFMMNDRPEHQTQMRGGLKWLDIQSLKRYEKPFKDCSASQQIELVDMIAYPKKAKPEMMQGVVFFNLMRSLTISGFYTTEMGTKDVGYIGNTPNQWNGIPADVLKQYNIAYTEKELKECISYDKA